MFAKLSRKFKRQIHQSPQLILSRKIQARIDHNYFSHGISSEDHAWVSGLIVTDGHLRKSHNAIEFFLQLQDYTILQQILNCVGCKKKISLKIVSNGHALATVNLCSKQLVNDMIEMFPCNWRRKADTLPSSAALFDFTRQSQKYVAAYIRGVSDGDGSFGYSFGDGVMSWELKSNSTEFIEGLYELIYAGCNVRCNRYTVGKRNIICIRKRQDLLDFGRWIYFDAKRFCCRKYERFVSYEEMVLTGCKQSNRIILMKQHKLQEALKRMQIHEKFFSLLDDAESHPEFIFTNTFKDRVELNRNLFDSWKKNFV